MTSNDVNFEILFTYYTVLLFGGMILQKTTYFNTLGPNLDAAEEFRIQNDF